MLLKQWVGEMTCCLDLPSLRSGTGGGRLPDSTTLGAYLSGAATQLACHTVDVLEQLLLSGAVADAGSMSGLIDVLHSATQHLAWDLTLLQDFWHTAAPRFIAAWPRIAAHVGRLQVVSPNCVAQTTSGGVLLMVASLMSPVADAQCLEAGLAVTRSDAHLCGGAGIAPKLLQALADRCA